MKINVNISGGGKKKFTFDTSKIRNEDAKQFADDVLGIIGGAARDIRARIAEYQSSSHLPDPDATPGAARQQAEPETEPAVGGSGPCAELIAELDLEGRDLQTVPMGEHSAVAMSILDTDDEVELWRRLRAATKGSGCYPLYVTRDDLESEMWRKANDPAIDPTDLRRFSEIRAELFAANPWPVREPVFGSFQHGSTVRRFGHGPTEHQLSQHEFASDHELDEYLFAWERDTFGDEAVVAAGRPDAVSWFPFDPDHITVLFVPVEDGANTLPLLRYYPIDDRAEHIVPLMNDLAIWHRDYGAELVANYGTVLQFIIARPPTDLDTAYGLAKEHDVVATSTLPAPGLTRRGYAADLIGRNRWFLHDRP